MAWIEIKLNASAPLAKRLSHHLEKLGALAITTEDAGDQPLYEPKPGTLPIWDEIILTGLFPENAPIETIKQVLIQDYGDEVTIEINPLPDQDWERTWMQDFKPMQFGSRLWIIPSFEQCKMTPYQVTLDPGLAFGTGKHPTTALCLQWLDQHIKGNETIIDYGCGSGILAIAALKLGASQVVAIDYDPQAIEATIQNAIQNQVETQLTTGLPTDIIPIKADIIIANILANPLMELVETFANLSLPTGKIVLSGILKEQAPAVIQAYKPWFVIDNQVQLDEWVRLDGRKFKDKNG